MTGPTCLTVKSISERSSFVPEVSIPDYQDHKTNRSAVTAAYIPGIAFPIFDYRVSNNSFGDSFLVDGKVEPHGPSDPSYIAKIKKNCNGQVVFPGGA